MRSVHLKLESTLELDVVQVWGTRGCILHTVFRDNMPIFASLCGVWASLAIWREGSKLMAFFPLLLSMMQCVACPDCSAGLCCNLCVIVLFPLWYSSIWMALLSGKFLKNQIFTVTESYLQWKWYTLYLEMTEKWVHVLSFFLIANMLSFVHSHWIAEWLFGGVLFLQLQYQPSS